MSNPHQEPLPENLSLVEAVRIIAERTAFRTEAERAAVLASIDSEINGPDDEPDTEPSDDEPNPEPKPEPDASAKPDPSTPGGVKTARRSR